MKYIPNRILRKIKRATPSYSSGGSSIRSPGIYTESGEYSSGYKNIIIYVQNGLSEKNDLFLKIAKSIFKIQSNNSRKYALLIFGFGNTKNLQHENKYFDFGYINDAYNDHKIVRTISRISGNNKVNKAIIPELFPKTDIRSLYHGKTKVKRDDLLIIIGNKGEVFFSKDIRDKIKTRIRKRMLLVEIENENTDYIFKPREVNFSNFN